MYLISVCPLPHIPLQSHFMHKDSTYRINVYTFNKTLEFADRIKRIDVSICVNLCVWLTHDTNMWCVCVNVWNVMFWILSPGYGLSSVWGHSEPEEPSERLLLVGRLWHRPQQHPWASKLRLFWPMGEMFFIFCVHMTNKRWFKTQGFLSFQIPAPDNGWPAWTDSLPQREEPTFYREHQYGCWVVIHHGQPC